VAPKDPIGIRGLGSASLLFSYLQIGPYKETHMLLAILVVVLILALVGSVPTWPHSRDWGYYPSGGLGVILLILIVLFLMGRL
jgi:hypothetical protein